MHASGRQYDLDSGCRRLFEVLADQRTEPGQACATEDAGSKLQAAYFAHTRLFRHVRLGIKRDVNTLDRIQRENQLKASFLLRSKSLLQILVKAHQVIGQTANNSTVGPRSIRLYGSHAAKAQCVNKAKCRNPIEFGAKQGTALIYQSNLIKGSHDFTETQSDVHTLDDQLVRATIVKQSTGVALIYDYSYLYFRGTVNDNSAIGIRH